MKSADSKRSYNDACGIAHALELIGERWALLVLRELMFGPRRFSDLKADLSGISPAVLVQRLTELEERGLVRKVRLPPPASVQVYEATPWGLEADLVLRTLGNWALRSPRHDPTTKPVNAVATMLSLKGLIDPDKALGFDACVGFRFGDNAYVATVCDGKLEVEQREPSGCDAVISGTPEQIVLVAHCGAPLETLQIDGDPAVAKRFMTIFSMPAKAS